MATESISAPCLKCGAPARKPYRQIDNYYPQLCPACHRAREDLIEEARKEHRRKYRGEVRRFHRHEARR